MKEPKVKAFLSAFQALFSNDDDNDDGEKIDNKDKDVYADQAHNADKDLHIFTFVVGSLKE
jgi:hypothetical protein